MKLSENELHAYVDDQLALERRRAVEAQLAEAPDEAERAAAYRAQNAALHALFDPVLGEPVPGRFQRTRARRSGARYGVAAALIVVGVVIGWFAHVLLEQHVPSPPSLARRAAVAHAVYAPEVRHPVEVGADQEEHLIAWLSKRLGAQLKAPVLTTEGYELVGGRLLPDEGGAVAQFMYQDNKGRRLTLYVSRLAVRTRDTAFRFSQEDRVAVFYWIDGSLGYALSAELPKAELLDIATAVYKQLNP